MSCTTVACAESIGLQVVGPAKIQDLVGPLYFFGNSTTYRLIRVSATLPSLFQSSNLRSCKIEFILECLEANQSQRSLEKN